MEVRWLAVLSNGEEAVENEGKFTIRPGERLPWVNLCRYCFDNGLKLSSLDLFLGDRLVYLPQDGPWHIERVKTPDAYSLNYMVELDDVLGNEGPPQQTHYVDVATHYGDLAVHYVQQTTGLLNSWIVVTEGDAPLARVEYGRSTG